MAIEGKKVLNIQIPASLYVLVKRIAVEQDTSVTQIIIKYLQYLRAQKNNYKCKETLCATSKKDKLKLEDLASTTVD